jgi:hypothetical protein
MKSFTPEDVAALSCKELTTVMTWIRAKKLPAKGKRSYSIEADAVRDFLRKQETLKRKAAKSA